MVDLRPEGRGHVLELAAPDPVHDAVDEDEQADGDDDRADHRSLLHRPHERDLEHGAEHEGDRERREERLPVRQAPLDELPGYVRRRHRELSLGEVDDPGRAVDEDECEREAAVDGAEREPLHRQLGEDLAAQAADEQACGARDQEQADRRHDAAQRGAAAPEAGAGGAFERSHRAQ